MEICPISDNFEKNQKYLKSLNSVLDTVDWIDKKHYMLLSSYSRMINGNYARYTVQVYI
jgi:hypothetical protein